MIMNCKKSCETALRYRIAAERYATKRTQIEEEAKRLIDEAHEVYEKELLIIKNGETK